MSEGAAGGAGVAGARGPRPGRVRHILAPVLSALLATAVAVPVTWHVASRTGEADVLPPPAFSSGQEARQHLLSQLPDHDAPGTVLLEGSRFRAVSAAFPPGRYRVDLICGLMSRQVEGARELRVVMRTPDNIRTVTLPCPSTPLSMPEPLDFTGSAAGVVEIHYENPAEPPAHVLLVQLVPVTATGEVRDA
ncbi:MAG TPA: hypothetical protein VKY81_12325 [Natronosporangium sp.]|nr:hypothetical protein [Natronosporangium sp.]